MFKKFKIKRLTKATIEACDTMDYDGAFKHALSLLELLGKSPDNTDAFRTILVRAGMDDKYVEYYLAKYKCILPNATFDDFLKHQEAKKVVYPENSYEIECDTIDAQLESGHISRDYAEVLRGELELKYFDKLHSNTQKEILDLKKKKIRERILTARYRDGQISYLDYQKSLASLNNEKWFNYEIKIDPELDLPTAFEIQFDYNPEFVQWLKTHGVTLTPQEEDELDDGESYDDKLTEKWVKRSLISLAAGMLQDNSGETFRSVVASEPEAQIVENFEIDPEQLDEMKDNLSKEEFDRIIELSKQRRIYR